MAKSKPVKPAAKAKAVSAPRTAPSKVVSKAKAPAPAKADSKARQKIQPKPSPKTKAPKTAAKTAPKNILKTQKNSAPKSPKPAPTKAKVAPKTAAKIKPASKAANPVPKAQAPARKPSPATASSLGKAEIKPAKVATHSKPAAAANVKTPAKSPAPAAAAKAVPAQKPSAIASKKRETPSKGAIGNAVPSKETPTKTAATKTAATPTPPSKTSSKGSALLGAKASQKVEDTAPKIKRGKPIKLADLTDPFLILQRDRIYQLRDSILESMHGVAKDTLRSRAEGSEASAFGMHQADAGSDAYDRDFALSLLSQEQDALYEIEEALKRMELGVYGICEMSGKRIPDARLEALPFARYTVECQSEVERQKKLYKARMPVTSLFGLTDEESSEGEEEEQSLESKD